MRLVILSLLTLGYPLLVYLGVHHFEPRIVAALLALIALVRAIATREKTWLVVSVCALLLSAAAAIGNQELPLKLYPVLVNAALLIIFMISLRFPPTAIERLARIREPDLAPSGIRYTRQVTWVWCGFFLVNGSIALITALWASTEVWALYNGLISYLLMASLFSIEWLIRQKVKAKALDD
ncbi:MAG: hypothetical protein KBT61_01530 [Paraperlucidibaca sp.]|nr:hypothetical protein [Paraperlucidibaca sp.]MBQ0841626.1 hypothetical protein [Paraperlucidibaca sp.]